MSSLRDRLPLAIQKRNTYYVGYPHLPPGDPGFHYTYQQLGDVIRDLAGPMGLERAFVHFWGAYSVQPPGCLPFDPAPGPDPPAGLYQDLPSEPPRPVRIRLIPYYAWNNRGEPKMTVWIPLH